MEDDMSERSEGRLRVLYFAALRERLGLAEEEVDWPPAGGTVACLRAHLAARHDDLASLFTADALKIAVNQRYADAKTLIRPGDEVALFPPVTGG